MFEVRHPLLLHAIPTKALLALALLLPASPAVALEMPFGSEQTISTAADAAHSVYAVDLDGDGDLDLLSASYNDNKIAWYENSAGDGSAWTARTISTSATVAWSVIATDVDRDGDLDVLSASLGDDTIAWYENADLDSNGVPDATWTERAITTGADGAASVFAADLDGDGDPDVLSASSLDSRIAWYESADLDSDGLPDATWTARTITTSASGAASVFAADLDGDGDLDALSASETDNKIAWYENTASDGSSWTVHTITTSALGALSVFAADVDGDGDLDALSASSADNKVAWYENDGTPGGTGDWAAHTITTAAIGAQSLFTADLDGDGDLDLLSASSSDDKIAWYENSAGDGSSWTAHTITTGADVARAVFAADLDGDGDLDVLSASSSDDKIAWYENGDTLVRDSTFGASSQISADTNQTWSVVLSDVDRDADLDLLAANWGGANRLYFNDGIGIFGAGSDIDSDGNDTISAVLGDVDEDGDPDLIVGNWGEANRLFLNDGSGGFGAGSDLDTDGYNTRSVLLGDMDGDGDLDLVTGNANTNNRLFLNDGSGGFGAAMDIDTDGLNSTSMDIGDIDGDGDLDIAEGNWNQVNRIFLNDGAGNFTDVYITGTYNTRSVVLGDVDGDGDLDLVRGNESQTNRLHLNDGTGGFDAGADITADTEVTRFVSLADVDADGDLDLIAGNNSQANRLYLNDGTGTFSATSITADAHATYSVALGDLDGDGDLDLVAGNYGQANRLHPNRRSLFVFEESDWASMAGATEGLDTTAANMALADEVTVEPPDNEPLGPTLTFDAANSGLCSSFVLSTLESGAGFTFDDNEGSSAWNEALSVGDVDDYEDDDFEFDFQVGPPLRGFGFYLLDNEQDATESYTVHGSDGQTLGVAPGSDIPDSDGHLTTFVGVITGERDPWVSRAEFNEASDGDDIAMLDFRFNLDTVTDRDSDGLTDCQEAGAGTDPDASDSDSDGVIDGEDSDPLDPYLCGDIDSDSCEDCLGGTYDPANDGTDADSDGICDATDCDSTNPNCTTDCTDADSDGYCVGHDCNESNPNCTGDCTDADSDGYCVGHDCNDSNPNCSASCTDADSDGYCVGHDCNESNPNCSASCTDSDSDGYCVGHDCNESNPNCTGDCTDADSDGYCVGHDCNEADPNCSASCTDADSDGYCVGHDCNESNPNCSASCADADSDGYCIGHDCDETTADCTADCTDADSDGYWACEDDCDDTIATVYPGAPPLCDGLNNDCDDPLWPALGPVGWGEDEISTTADGAWSVHAADLDGDGDQDVLSAHAYGDSFAWHENISGDGSAWTEHLLSTTADNARSVFASDLDSDGDLDILSASLSDDTVAWYENQGGSPPTFSEQVITQDPDGAASVFAADIDSDGDPDVLLASYYDDTVAWYLNDGTPGGLGDWTAYEITTAASGAISVSAADVDGDGDIDVLSASLGDDTIAWYENEDLDSDGLPDASWTPHTITSSADYAYSVVAADLDSDGDVDVLSASIDDDTIAWYENMDGSGSFGPPQLISNLADGARSVFVADMDDDGDFDVLSASQNDDTIAWYENDGTPGGLGDWTLHVVSSAADGASAVFAADVDSDGYTDVLSASITDDTVAWYSAGTIERDDDGDGLAECDGDCDDSVASCTTDCTDADSDGMPLCAGDCDDTVASCTTDCTDADSDGMRACDGDCNNSNPYCTSDCTDADTDGYCVTTDCSDANAQCTTDCTDADSDGYCVGHDCNEADPNCSAICTDTDSDGYCVGADCNDLDPNNWKSCLTCADGDGDLDLVEAIQSLPDRLCLNDGTGVFGACSNIDVDSDDDVSLSLDLGDVDVDGDLDLVVGRYGWDPTQLYLNDGTGVLGARSQIIGDDDFRSTESIEFGDVDGDGDLDLVEGNTNGVSRLYLNDGMGGFGAGSDIYGISLTPFALGDLDGDGDLDLAGRDAGQLYLYVLANDGSGTFTWHTRTDDALFINDITIGDVDGDGDLDLVAGRNGTADNAYNRLYLNNGAGYFDTTMLIGGGTRYTQSVVLGDVDGDGDLDLVEGTILHNRVFLNNGNGLFGAPLDVTSDSHDTRSVVLGDVDGDGDLDLVAGNYGQADRLYLNQCSDTGTCNGTVNPWAGVTGSDILSDSLWVRAIVLGDVDGDADGFYVGCDAYVTFSGPDCDVANPDCTTDCTDADSDGICVTLDCDDATPSSGSTLFPETISAPDGDTLAWTTAMAVRWRKGELSGLSSYATTGAGSLAAASSLDISADSPDSGSGMYYMVREQGCGSWQTALGTEPGRDAELPLP